MSEEKRKVQGLKFDQTRVTLAVVFIASLWAFVTSLFILGWQSERPTSPIGWFYLSVAIPFGIYALLGSGAMLIAFARSTTFYVARDKLFFVGWANWSWRLTDIVSVEGRGVGKSKALVFKLKDGQEKPLSIILLRDDASRVADAVRELIQPWSPTPQPLHAALD